jgi:hypothetical protein
MHHMKYDSLNKNAEPTSAMSNCYHLTQGGLRKLLSASPFCSHPQHFLYFLVLAALASPPRPPRHHPLHRRYSISSPLPPPTATAIVATAAASRNRNRAALRSTSPQHRSAPLSLALLLKTKLEFVRHNDFFKQFLKDQGLVIN